MSPWPFNLCAWLRANGVEAVQRAAELFPNLAADHRGIDDAPAADPEPDTDVGAPIDQPDDVPVQRPDGSMLRGGADESEAAQLRAAEGWIDFSDGRSATKKTVKARPDKYGAGSEEWMP